LDDDRSWIVLTESNRFVWPGPDLRPVDSDSGYYGPLTPRFFAEVKQRFVAIARDADPMLADLRTCCGLIGGRRSLGIRNGLGPGGRATLAGDETPHQQNASAGSRYAADSGRPGVPAEGAIHRGGEIRGPDWLLAPARRGARHAREGDARQVYAWLPGETNWGGSRCWRHGTD
ncbi:MAG: hypothetical protein KDA37_05890, partial [Planctomycetales bacterium]|nr:hypothetical protein [Planctomycetales bacterium]